MLEVLFFLCVLGIQLTRQHYIFRRLYLSRKRWDREPSPVPHVSASDYVLIPVQADYLAAEDMAELIGTVQSIKRQINPKLKIGGVFLTMANETNFRKDIVKSVKENYGKRLPVMEAVIPATVRLAEVSTAGKSIFRHDPKGRAADAYRELVKEVTGFGEKQRSKSADLCR